MRIVGIDPSLASTGVAFGDGSLAALKQKPSDGDRRLVNIKAGVWTAVEGADLVIMEDLPRNAMGAGVTGMVQGVIRELLQESGVPYITVTPATLKKFATGAGNAKKPVMRIAWREYSDVDVANNDMVDAAWLREIGRYLTGQQPMERSYWECVEPLRPQVDAIMNGYQLN